MPIDKPQLGAIASESASYSPIKSVGSGSNNEIPTIMNNISGLLNLSAQAIDRNKHLQDEEDINNAKFVAHNDIINIETARTTGNSPDSDLNSIYQKGKESGLTETEINNNMYDLVIGKRAGEIQGEAGKGDTKYFEAMVTGKNTMWSKLAVGDKEKIVSEQLNKAYAIAGTDGDIQSEFNTSSVVMKRYGKTEDDLGNMYIYRAIDRAKSGDDRLLSNLKNIKNSQGISITDTMAGAEAYSKKIQELTTWRDHESQRIERQRVLDQQNNADSIFVRIASGEDPTKIASEITLYTKQDKINFEDASRLINISKQFADDRNFSKKSDLGKFQEAYTLAMNGELGSNFDYSKLSYEDAHTVRKVQAENGDANGRAKEEITIVRSNIRAGASSMAGFDMAGNIVNSFGNPQAQLQLGAFAKAVADNELNLFRITNKRQPTFEEGQELLKKLEPKINEKKAELMAMSKANISSKRNTSVANEVSKPISTSVVINAVELDNKALEIFKSNGQEAYNSYLDSLTDAEADALILYHKNKGKNK